MLLNFLSPIYLIFFWILWQPTTRISKYCGCSFGEEKNYRDDNGKMWWFVEQSRQENKKIKMETVVWN